MKAGRDVVAGRQIGKEEHIAGCANAEGRDDRKDTPAAGIGRVLELHESWLGPQ